LSSAAAAAAAATTILYGNVFRYLQLLAANVPLRRLRLHLMPIAAVIALIIQK
jgi:hypothetical protein